MGIMVSQLRKVLLCIYLLFGFYVLEASKTKDISGQVLTCGSVQYSHGNFIVLLQRELAQWYEVTIPHIILILNKPVIAYSSNAQYQAR